MPAYRMFCGELDGDLCIGHLGASAVKVRVSVGKMFQETNWRKGWRQAIRNGWRVVPVRVEKIQGRR